MVTFEAGKRFIAKFSDSANISISFFACKLKNFVSNPV